MKTGSRAAVISVISFALIGGGGVSAASIGKDGLRGEHGQVLTEVTTAAGGSSLGGVNGPGLSALFRMPAGLAAMPDGSLLIADSRNHLIRKWDHGQIGSYAGLIYKLDEKGFPAGGLLDGTRDMSVFREPMGMAADSSGNVYVADSENHAVRKIGADGQVTTLAGSGLIGSKDGKGREATFHHPTDVAVAPDGTVYVADSLNHLIRRITPEGEVSTLNAASSRVIAVTPGQAVMAGDYQDGDLVAARFNEPTSLVLDSKGNLYVSDSGNQRIRYIDLGQGKVTTVAGSSLASDASGLYDKNELYAPGDDADGNALQAKFHYPMGLALTEEGGLVIADSQNHAIRYLKDGLVTTLAGSADGSPGAADGTESGARFERPTDVAVAADGNVYVADSFNNKIRKISLYRSPDPVPQDDRIKVVLDSKWIEFDAQPEIVNGRTMVPVRAIAEALGYKVGFDESTRTVQLVKDAVTIELYVGRTGIRRMEQGKGPVMKPTDTEPYIKQDLTYVPVRFFAEETGLDVQWNDANRTVILRKKTSASS
ncbi:hypothetical protein LJK87_04300 [Paenibacillus sp. P25]|nr:hypothetical protein LJK87_04300 [Paenibacillus sp. P25]